jgi:hypothetical protein
MARIQFGRRVRSGPALKTIESSSRASIRISDGHRIAKPEFLTKCQLLGRSRPEKRFNVKSSTFGLLNTDVPDSELGILSPVSNS